MEKALATKTESGHSNETALGNPSLSGGLQPLRTPDSPYKNFQRTFGNQALLRLLDSGTIRTKLRVSQPGDPDEQEADRAADQVVATMRAPKIQRKCGCGGTCASCSEEENQTIHRSAKFPFLLSSPLGIQRAPDDKAGTAPEEPHHHPHKKAHDGPGVEALVIEDEAKEIKPHQMRKSQFIALLRTDACSTVDAVLASVAKTTKGCPYIEKWLGFYEKQSASHIAGVVRKYAPETAKARSAHEVIRFVVVRIQRAATTWAKTGKIEGLPKEFAEQAQKKSALDKLHDFASTGVAGAIFGFIGGKKPEKSNSEKLSRKAANAGPEPAHDAASVRAQLGSGHSLDSRVQSQMSSAFGQDFSNVRIHTDSSSAKLSSDLNARAFTVGSDVAFASGEYKPGTLIGDALIAHELAHVVQQNGARSPHVPMMKGKTDYNALEQDADQAAAGAILGNWFGVGKNALRTTRSAGPALRSGLKLQSCSKTNTTSPQGWSVDDLKSNFGVCDGTSSAHTAVEAVTVQVGQSSEIATGGATVGSTITLDPNQSKCYATQVLVLELSNYSHRADFKQIREDAKAGNVSREEYIRRHELQEYDGVKKALATYDSCKDKWHCTESFYGGYRSASFDEYYPKVPSIHKEHYGQYWDAQFKTAYEAKHPPAPPPSAPPPPAHH